MLARSRIVTLRNGERLRTPLLVPSVSSKGFQLFGDTATTSPQPPERAPISEAGLYLEVAAPNINESLLISGYDAHHKLIPQSEALSGDFLASIYGNPQLLFVDSGGYELRPGYDEDDVYHYAGGQQFSEEAYLSLLQGFSPDLRGIVVNPDRLGVPYAEQVAAAQTFFSSLPPGLCSDMLLKPEVENSGHNVDQIAALAGELRQFDIVGVTEKELGDTVEKRMLALARLRLALDDHDVPAPIHIFGALDPVLTPIYFLAGAEIFDGLTWLRYWFHEGQALYAPSYPVLTDSFPLRRPQWQSKMHSSNLDYIQRLANQMRVYVTDGSFEVFRSNADLIQGAYARLRSLEGRA